MSWSRSSEIVGQARRLPKPMASLPYNSIRNESSVLQFAKISGDISFEIKIPNRRATKKRSVDDRAPHDRLMNQVQRAQDRRVNNDEEEHRNHEMTRPIFLRNESVSDEHHENSDHSNERRGDMQPFASRDALAAHDVRSDIENREQDREIHSGSCQRRKPSQDSDRKRWLCLCHGKVDIDCAFCQQIGSHHKLSPASPSRDAGLSAFADAFRFHCNCPSEVMKASAVTGRKAEVQRLGINNQASLAWLRVSVASKTSTN